MRKARKKATKAEVLEAAKGLLRSWARKGGTVRARRLTAEERQAIARKAARARWGTERK
jgi:hypothetical protein